MEYKFDVAYLLKILKTEKLSELIDNIDLVPLDMNLALWAAEDAGEIKIDMDNDKVELLVDPTPSGDEILGNKIIRVLQHYAKATTNLTRGRLNSQIKDGITGQGYGWETYITTVQWLIDSGQILEKVVVVPEEKRMIKVKRHKEKEMVVRPEHKFAFLCLPDNEDDNDEWNQRSVDKFIANYEKA